jgi:predicted nucleotide-binding protein
MQVLLDEGCEVTIWSQGVFGLSQGTLESLVLALNQFDFAILILTPDDLVTSREEVRSTPRDNVLFELGLFVGGLGRERTFVVYDRTAQLKIPSDLAGISAATFEPHSSGNLESALGAAASRIEGEIEKLGIRDRERLRRISDDQERTIKLLEGILHSIGGIGADLYDVWLKEREEA